MHRDIRFPQRSIRYVRFVKRAQRESILRERDTSFSSHRYIYIYVAVLAQLSIST